MALCPRCNKNADDLKPINPGMKMVLQAGGHKEALPPNVCSACHEDLAHAVSFGARLRAEQQFQNQNRMNMWSNRVKLVKQARQCMTQKLYADAAVNYEKYLRVLELVYDVQKGGLAPELFSNSKRSKELTVLTSVYWDLFRIYDTSPRFSERQAAIAHKLADFVRFSPIFPDIVKKAEAFEKVANSPQHVKTFLKVSKSNRPRCFIATAVYHYPEHPKVQQFQYFRDAHLLNSSVGRALVKLYYRTSPRFAKWLDRGRHRQVMVRWFLNGLSLLFPRPRK